MIIIVVIIISEGNLRLFSRCFHCHQPGPPSEEVPRLQHGHSEEELRTCELKEYQGNSHITRRETQFFQLVWCLLPLSEGCGKDEASRDRNELKSKARALSLNKPRFGCSHRHGGLGNWRAED